MRCAEPLCGFEFFFEFVIFFPEKEDCVNILVKKIIDSVAYKAGIVKIINIFNKGRI